MKKIQSLRNNNNYFTNISDKAATIAKRINIEPSKPRVVGRESYRYSTTLSNKRTQIPINNVHNFIHCIMEFDKIIVG